MGVHLLLGTIELHARGNISCLYIIVRQYNMLTMASSLSVVKLCLVKFVFSTAKETCVVLQGLPNTFDPYHRQRLNPNVLNMSPSPSNRQHIYHNHIHKPKFCQRIIFKRQLGPIVEFPPFKLIFFSASSIIIIILFSKFTIDATFTHKKQLQQNAKKVLDKIWASIWGVDVINKI